MSLRNFATTEVSLLLDIQTGSWEARLLIAKCDPLLMGSIQGVMLPGLLDYCQPEWEYVYIKIHVRPNGGKVVCDINYLINHQNHQVNHSQSMVLICSYYPQAMSSGFFSLEGDETRPPDIQANSPKRAQQLVQILTDLGPTFIKIGQAELWWCPATRKTTDRSEVYD